MRQLVDKVPGFLLTCIEVKESARIDLDEFKSWQSNKHKKIQTVGKHLQGNVVLRRKPRFELKCTSI